MPDKTFFLANIAKCDKKEQLKKMLAFNLSPVLQQVKPSELIVLKKKCFEKVWLKVKAGIIKDLGLNCKTLHSSPDSIYLLFYNENMLRARLFDAHCQKLLAENNYKNILSMHSLLYQLGKRMKDSLPHEIGLFLGYPVHDVEGFIRFSGKNFCACKYWKVYENPEYSLDKFRQIDIARNHAAKLLNGSITLNRAVKLIKTM